MGRGQLLALAPFFLLHCSCAVRNNDASLVTKLLADDDGEDEGPALCEQAKQAQDSQWLWRFRLSNAVARELSATESYVLSDAEDCSGEEMASVSVSLKIDDCHPINQSWAAITMEPTHVHGRLFLCPARRNLTGGRCLAWLLPPDKSWRPHFLLLAIPFMSNNKKLLDLHLGESHPGVDILEYVMLVVVLGFIATACRALYILFFHHREIFGSSQATPEAQEGGTSPNQVGRVDSIGGQTKASPIDISSPFWESVDAWVNSSLFVIAVISFLGVIVRILIHVESPPEGPSEQPLEVVEKMDLKTFALSDMIEPSLITLAIAWPCTFGNILLFRTWMSVCRLQLYSAALSRGICIRGNNPLSASALQIGGCVFLLIFCCVATAFRLWQSKGSEGVSIAKKLAFLVINPMSTMLSILFFVYMRGRTHHMTQCPMAIDEMVKLIQEPDQHTGDIPEHPSIDGSCLAYCIKRGRVPVISEGAFCHICRHGQDPLKVIPAATEPLHEGQKFKVFDLSWHGRVVYELSGFSVAILNVPIAFFFFLILTAASVNFGIICLTMKPSLESITTSMNSLAKLVPAVKQWQTDYLFELNDIAHSFTFHVTIPPEGTNLITLRLPDGTQFSTAEHSYMATVELDGTQYPSVININASGFREAPTQYEISLVRTYNLVTGMKLMPLVNGQAMAHRWIPWGCVENSRYSVPRNTTDVEFTFFHQAYKMGIPVNRSEGEKMTSSVVTVFEPNPGVSWRTCQYHCKKIARCITADLGKEGCFLIWGPEPISDSDFALPLSQPMTLLPTSNLGARLCSSHTGGDCADMANMSAHHLTGTVKLDENPHGGFRKIRRSIQLYQTFGDRQVDLEFIKLVLIKGPVMPLDVLSHVDGVAKVEAKSDNERKTIDVTLGRYRPESSRSLLVLHLAILLPDASFQVKARNRSVVWNISDGHSGYRQWWAEECHSSPKVEEYSICGGWRRSQVASCHLDAWNPELVGFLHINSPELADEEVEMTVTTRTEDGIEPAAMAIHEACHLDFNGMSSVEGDELITPLVYEAAIMNCTSLRVDYSGTASKGAYSWEPDIIQFIRDGIEFYREEFPVLLRFFRKIEESELITDKLGFFFNISFGGCGDGTACIATERKNVRLNLLEIASRANETSSGGFIAAVCKSTTKEALLDGNMGYAALTKAVDRDKPSLVRDIATCIEEKVGHVPLVGGMLNSALLAMQRRNGELLNQVLRVTPCCCTIEDGSPQGLSYLEYAVSRGCLDCLDVLLRRCHNQITEDRLIFSPETNTERWPFNPEDLAKVFKKLPDLRKLSFAYSDTGMPRTMMRLVPLAREGALVDVEQISLYRMQSREVADDPINSQLAESFCELSEHLPNLRELHLGERFQEVDSLAVLACFAKNLPRLERLQVELPSKGHQRGAELWSSLIKGLRSIKSLKVVFAEPEATKGHPITLRPGDLAKELSGVQVMTIAQLSDKGEWPRKSFQRPDCTGGRFGKGFTNLTKEDD